MRVFLAVELDDSVRKQVGDFMDTVRARLDSSSRIAWTAAENLHLTLIFLGEVEADRIETIDAAVRNALTHEEGGEVALAGSGVFPSWREPRVLWVGVSEGEPLLQRLHARCAEALASLGFPPESRPFHPHLTLGRVKELRDRNTTLRAALETQQPFGRCAATEVVLMESRLHPQGARYLPRLRFPLARSAS